MCFSSGKEAVCEQNSIDLIYIIHSQTFRRYIVHFCTIAMFIKKHTVSRTYPLVNSTGLSTNPWLYIQSHLLFCSGRVFKGDFSLRYLVFRPNHKTKREYTAYISHVCTVSYMFPFHLPCVFSPFSLSFSFLTKILSLNHLSAFWSRRRYFETYVRYVSMFLTARHQIALLLCTCGHCLSVCETIGFSVCHFNIYSHPHVPF